jgi:DNA-binding NarL/FixJ family response regulator
MAQQKIDELIKKIELSEDNRSPSKMEELKEIVQLAVSNNPAFLVKFNEYDPAFCKKLLELAPNMVAAEIEFCVLLRLNFETKEIARYTKISVRAVEGKKYRIRRKLNIPSDQDINIWMTHI